MGDPPTLRFARSAAHPRCADDDVSGSDAALARWRAAPRDAAAELFAASAGRREVTEWGWAEFARRDARALARWTSSSAPPLAGADVVALDAAALSLPRPDLHAVRAGLVRRARRGAPRLAARGSGAAARGAADAAAAAPTDGVDPPRGSSPRDDEIDCLHYAEPDMGVHLAALFVSVLDAASPAQP